MNLRALAVHEEIRTVRSSPRERKRAKLAAAQTCSPLFPALGVFR
ncbi:hypothetical protein [Desmospora activa]|nr:hypothetical protein [Desmospora activa]